MGRFKHHSYFPKLKAQQAYRFPFVCLSCRKSFKFPASGRRLCPQCREPMEMLSRKFSAPQSSDLAQWEKIKYLVRHGFRFYSVYEATESGGKRAVRYPATLKEAVTFVQVFKSQDWPPAV